MYCRVKLRGWWHWQVINSRSWSLSGQERSITCNIVIRKTFGKITIPARSCIVVRSFTVSGAVIIVRVVIVMVVWLSLVLRCGLFWLVCPSSHQNLLLAVDAKGPSSCQVENQLLDSLAIQLYQVDQLGRGKAVQDELDLLCWAGTKLPHNQIVQR